MGKKFSHILLEEGFIPVAGTLEEAGGHFCLVVDGNPFSVDYNNGVRVVYDQDGKAWIRRDDYSRDDVRRLLDLISQHSPSGGASIGASVPHSNDGGAFLYRLFPREGWEAEEDGLV